ncbi:gamma-glutamyl-gamma-aminobutyrate hydrolase family protein [Peptococcaceae bacterium 1198_IL3148]
MAAPFIGITCCYDEQKGRVWLSDHYLNAVIAAGGIPLVLPVLTPVAKAKEMLNLCSGLLLPGGGDIDPLLFNEDPHPLNGEICPQCDDFELEITFQALQRGMPILGICRGAQVINVVAGGTVCQDISSEIDRPLKHMQQAPRWYPTHTITAVSGSLLEKIIGSAPVKVNSYHHQTVGKLGTGIKVSAYAPDGAIEAIEMADQQRFILGVQYHPEGMWKTDANAKAIFDCFIAAASDNKDVDI